jgi:uncharacterized protein YqiB (DUF1249 family)
MNEKVLRMEIYKTLVCLLVLASCASATLNVFYSDQGTSVRDLSSGSLLASGNLTIVVQNASGSVIYNETFWETNPYSIINGSWNAEIGENKSLPLSYMHKYYKSYYLNGQLVSFVNSSGDSISSLPFISSLGDIDFALLRNFPSPCADNYAMSGMTNESLTCFSIATSIGNTTIARNGTYNCPANTTAQNISIGAGGISAMCLPIGNGTGTNGEPSWNGNYTSVVENITNLQTNSSAVIANASRIDARLTFVNNSLNASDLAVRTLLNTTIANTSSLASTKAGTGTASCGAGTVAQNITTSTGGITSQCAPVSSSSSVGWVNITNFPAACAAGSALTQLLGTPVCTAFLQSFTELDPIFSAANTTIWNAINLRLTSAQVEALSNLTNYYTKSQTEGLQNLTYYTQTSGIAAFIGNATIARNGTYACPTNFTAQNISIGAGGVSAMCLPTGSGPQGPAGESTNVSVINNGDGTYLWKFYYSNGSNYYNFTTSNLTGPQGTQGPTGPSGANGSTGPQGPTGPAGANGSNASVVNGDSYIVVNNGVITFNLSQADQRYLNTTFISSLFPTYNNLSYAQIAANIGNWSLDMSSYTTTAAANLDGVRNNITNLQTNSSATIANVSQIAGRFEVANNTLNGSLAVIISNTSTYLTNMSNLTANVSTNYASLQAVIANASHLDATKTETTVSDVITTNISVINTSLQTAIGNVSGVIGNVSTLTANASTDSARLTIVNNSLNGSLAVIISNSSTYLTNMSGLTANVSTNYASLQTVIANASHLDATKTETTVSDVITTNVSVMNTSLQTAISNVSGIIGNVSTLTANASSDSARLTIVNNSLNGSLAIIISNTSTYLGNMSDLTNRTLFMNASLNASDLAVRTSLNTTIGNLSGLIGQFAVANNSLNGTLLVCVSNTSTYLTNMSVLTANVSTNTASLNTVIANSSQLSGRFDVANNTLNITMGTKASLSADQTFTGNNTFTKGVWITTATNKTTCVASERGMTWINQGGAGVTDLGYVCAKNSTDSYNPVLVWRAD